jgi:hypothetical protein
MTSLPRSAAYYDGNAADHAGRYASLRFEDVHTQIIDAVPAPPASVLEMAGVSKLQR